jgi:hypothetical protein
MADQPKRTDSRGQWTIKHADVGPEFQQLVRVAAERNRTLKLLESAGIKLAGVMSSVFRVSGMLMLKALAEHQRLLLRMQARHLDALGYEVMLRPKAAA